MIHDIILAKEVLEEGLLKYEDALERSSYKYDESILDDLWGVTIALPSIRHNNKALGRCFYKEKRLEVYPHEKHTKPQFIDTVLHELAHHISYIMFGRDGIGHSKRWKETCRIIGASDNMYGLQ